MACRPEFLSPGPPTEYVFACQADNDLYRVLTTGGKVYPRYAAAAEAVRAAPRDGAVLVVADGYPKQTTKIDAAVFEEVRKKSLRLSTLGGRCGG